MMDLYILNKELQSVAVIDSYKSLIWTDRYQSCGDFELYLAMDVDLLRYLQIDFYVWIRESKHCMIIEEIKIQSDTENGDHLIVTGRSLESILERRIVWGQQTFKGNLQDAIEKMLKENIIEPSLSERKIENFIFKKCFSPQVLYLEINHQYTGDDLYSIIQSLCEENHIGFQIILNEQNQFEFSLYAGKDRSYNQTDLPYVIFSPKFDNIISSNYFFSKRAFRNVNFVAGEGEGEERKTLILGDARGMNRRELFTDACDISSGYGEDILTQEEYNNQLMAKGLKALYEHAVKTAFEGEAEVTKTFRYGRDFHIGDIVQISDAYGNEGGAYITELVISHDENGISTYPTFQMLTQTEEVNQ